VARVPEISENLLQFRTPRKTGREKKMPAVGKTPLKPRANLSDFLNQVLKLFCHHSADQED
jgi:hypothetical protein